MLKILEKNAALKQTYGVQDLSVFRRKLAATQQAPCLLQLELWYDILKCPQITADTYGRAVVLSVTEPHVDKSGSVKKDKDEQFF